MTLSDLYRKKLALSENFSQLGIEAKGRNAWALYDHLQSRAHELDSQAGDLAHCLAMFGDGPLTSFEIKKLQDEVHGRSCAGSNPWYHGLNHIQEALQL